MTDDVFRAAFGNPVIVTFNQGKEGRCMQKVHSSHMTDSGMLQVRIL